VPPIEKRRREGCMIYGASLTIRLTPSELDRLREEAARRELLQSQAGRAAILALCAIHGEAADG